MMNDEEFDRQTEGWLFVVVFCVIGFFVVPIYPIAYLIFGLCFGVGNIIRLAWKASR